MPSISSPTSSPCSGQLDDLAGVWRSPRAGADADAPRLEDQLALLEWSGFAGRAPPSHRSRRGRKTWRRASTSAIRQLPPAARHACTMSRAAAALALSDGSTAFVLAVLDLVGRERAAAVPRFATKARPADPPGTGRHCHRLHAQPRQPGHAGAVGRHERGVREARGRAGPPMAIAQGAPGARAGRRVGGDDGARRRRAHRRGWPRPTRR